MWIRVMLILVALSSCHRNDVAVVEVAAASSLREVVDDLADAYTRQEGRPRIRARFGGTQLLSAQLAAGATTHVLLSADLTHVRRAMSDGWLKSPRRLASNELVVVTSDMHRGATFDQLATFDGFVVGVPGSPIGDYTESVLKRVTELKGAAFTDQIRAHIRSREGNTRAVLSKVALGHAAAAFVYKTDAMVAGLPVVELPSAVTVRCDVVGAASSTATADAQRWLRWLGSEEARVIWRRRGFATP